MLKFACIGPTVPWAPRCDPPSAKCLLSLWKERTSDLKITSGKIKNRRLNLKFVDIHN